MERLAAAVTKAQLRLWRAARSSVGTINAPWSFQQLHVKVSGGGRARPDLGGARTSSHAAYLAKKNENKKVKLQGEAETDLLVQQ